MNENTKLLGNFQHFEHPKNAELLDGSDFIRKTTKQSVFISGMTVQGESYFICPRCGAKHIHPEHGNGYKCNICQLKWQMYGSGLYIWE
jgi:predicted RNA-binding Zn-ribbon protein involved in translation (DUF1610 family)